MWGFVKVSEDYKKRSCYKKPIYSNYYYSLPTFFSSSGNYLWIIPEPIVFISIKDMLIPYFNKPSLPQTYKTKCTKLSNSDEKLAFLYRFTFLNKSLLNWEQLRKCGNLFFIKLGNNSFFRSHKQTRFFPGTVNFSKLVLSALKGQIPKLNDVWCFQSKVKNSSQTDHSYSKAELLQEGIFFLVHLYARDVLVLKKLEIKKTKPTLIMSVLKVEYCVVLVSSISNIFTNKTYLANKWMSFSNSNLALICSLLKKLAYPAIYFSISNAMHVKFNLGNLFISKD